MKKIIAGIFVTAAGMSLSAASFAASAEAKANYDAARDIAAANFKAARAQCNSLAGQPKDVCVEEAKDSRTRAEAEASATFKGTLKAQTEARKDIAEADYSVAKVRCNSKNGNEKDVCVKEAKAARIAAEADAKADKKVIEARVDALDDKIDAQYKVEREKCDSLAGSVKDSCVAQAKVKFGK